MTAQAMSNPVHLPLPEPWPAPTPSCAVCTALARQREQAQAAGDYSRVSDLNVEIRAHQDPHRRR